MTYTEFRDKVNRKLGKAHGLRPVLEFAQGLDFGRRYVQHRILGKDQSRAATRELYVEWVNYCNLRCKFCALDHLQVKERMSMEVWTRILYEVTIDKRFEGLEYIHLHNGGETLLHPQSVEMLELLDSYYLRSRAEGKHFPKVELLTNALPITPKKQEAILNCKAIKSIGFSMDGGSPEAYEAIRVRAKWDKFKEILESMAAANAQLEEPKHLYIISVLPDKKSMEAAEQHEDFRALLNTVDSYELRLAHDWGGQVEVNGEMQSSKRAKPWKWGCSMMMDQLVLLPNGDVSICCNDLNGKGTMANIMADGLYGAYASPKRREWLDQMARNQSQQIELCKDCERF